MHEVLTHFCRFYEKLDENPLSDLSLIYHPQVRFCDPVHCIEGRDDLIHYFETMLQSVTACYFEIAQVSELENSAYIRWTMHYRHPKLNAGNTIAVDGVSYIEFDQQVTFHRDYFDLGVMLYEQIPLLGSAVRFIKHKIGASD